VLCACAAARGLAVGPPLNVAALVGCTGATSRTALLEQGLGGFDPTALVDDLRTAGEWGIAREVVLASCASGSMPLAPACDALAAAFRREGRLDEALDVMGALHSAGGRCNPNQGAALMGELIRAGRAESALALLDAFGERADNKTHAVLLTRFLEVGDPTWEIHISIFGTTHLSVRIPRIPTHKPPGAAEALFQFEADTESQPIFVSSLRVFPT